ncbi:MAG: S8 family serine peptidase [Planctomycetales bacterium]|nr:S8 family serine peptidase [Planctomycetales bacterium]
MRHRSVCRSLVRELLEARSLLTANTLAVEESGWVHASSEADDPIPLDEAGDSFVMAAPLGNLRETTIRVGRVGGIDATDYYEFHLSEMAIVDVALFDLQQDATLALFDAAEQMQAYSSEPATTVESIHRLLPAGDYFVLVLSTADTTTPYQLALSPSTDGLVSQDAAKPDLGGDAFGRATDLGTLSAAVGLHDKVGDTDPADVFLINVPQNQSVTFQLDQLTANVDMHVITQGGQLVDRSRNASTTSERLQLNLTSGSYFVLLFPVDPKSSDYRLQILPSATATSPPPTNSPATTPPSTVTIDGGDTFNRATQLGTITSWQRRESIGGPDAADVFQFHLPENSNVRVMLSKLSADIDVYMFDASYRLMGRNYQAGAVSESIETYLSKGSYFVIVIPHGNVSSDYLLQIQTEVQPTPAASLRTTNDLPVPLPDVVQYGGSSNWSVNSVNAPEAWAYGFAGKDVVVAVVDSGVDRFHNDLATNIWRNTEEVPGDRIDNDGNGYIDDVYGWNFVNDNASVADLTGHGTHVAGIVASRSDGVGSTGIAFQSKIMPLRVLDANGNGRTSNVAAAIMYAVDNGADIITLSLSSDGYSAAIYNALVYARDHNVFVTVAAGNGGRTEPSYPAIHSNELTNVLSVGAYDTAGNRAAFSNRVGNSGAVQVEAPGVSVYSTQPNNDYGTWYGTSMAAPHAAGVAALVMSANTRLNPAQVRTALVYMASRQVPGADSAGGLNAAGSVPLAANAQVPNQIAAQPELPGALPVIERIAVHAEGAVSRWDAAAYLAGRDDKADPFTDPSDV